MGNKVIRAAMVTVTAGGPKRREDQEGRRIENFCEGGLASALAVSSLRELGIMFRRLRLGMLASLFQADQ